MAELDLEGFLKESAVSDLDWLDVDAEEYRSLDRLPKQNLDIVPDLEALWNREGESPTSYLVPNVVPVPTPGISNPHTMGDMSQEHGRLRAQAEEIRKIARLTLIQSPDVARLRDVLVKRFGSDVVAANASDLMSAVKERGLLGKLYIAAEDFSNCDQGTGTEFVRKYASEAKYVLAKKACGGCCHATKTPTGGTQCGVFQKEIQVEIPYTNKLAETVEREQAGRGRLVQAGEGTPRARIKYALLAPLAGRPTQAYQGSGVVRTASVSVDPKAAHEKLLSAGSLVRKKQAADQVSFEAKSVIAFLHREMVKGLTRETLGKSLKLAFDTSLLTRTHAHWGPLFNEAGLYGTVYTKQASFDDCRVGADFLARHNPGIRAIVAGDKCGSCIYSKGRCLMYGKTLVKNASEIMTPETVEAVLLEHRTAGRIPWEHKTAASWGDSPAQALKAMHEAVQKSVTLRAQPRMGFMRGFHGNIVPHTTAGLTKRDILKQASRFMNEGLYGRDLLSALKSRFEARDLFAAKADLRTVLAEQGLQGIYYVDPAAYDDYGRGCEEASRLHRTRLLAYVKEGSKCASCVHQTRLGFCSKIDKELVVEPPYVDKLAQQREILASGSSTDVPYASLVNNATSTLAEYQMQQDLAVEVKNASDPDNVSIEFGTGSIKL